MSRTSVYRLAVTTTLFVAWVLLLPLSERASAQVRQSAKVVVGGVELHYIEQGEGEPVILLHGGQGDYRAWSSLTEALAPRYRVISYSRRYHWPNANTLTAPNHSALIDADDLAGLITALGLRSAHLVGTSYGAFTALALAIKRPEMVRSMVLAEPPVHRWVTDTARGAALYRERVATVHEPARRAFAAGDDEAAMRLFIDAFDGRGTFDRLPAERRASVMQNARFFKAITSSSDPFPDLPKDAVRRLKVPVLIVRGADTDELHGMVVEELGRLLPGARRVTIPQAGHGSPRQNPRAFNGAVLEFLEPPRNNSFAAGAEVRVWSAIGMRQVMLDLGPKFERATGHRLKVSFDSGGVIFKRLERGETADVVMINRAGIKGLAEAGRVVQGSVTDLATSKVGVAVRKGAPKPDISTPEAFRRAMLEAKTVACPDPALGGSSGVHIAKVFKRLGISEAVRLKLVFVSTPEQAQTMPGHLVAEGKAEVALHQMQELMAVPGIEIVGPLPGDLQETFVFSAAVMTGANDVKAAKALIEFLRTAEARAVIKAKGMEPAIP